MYGRIFLGPGVGRWCAGFGRSLSLLQGGFEIIALTLFAHAANAGAYAISKDFLKDSKPSQQKTARAHKAQAGVAFYEPHSYNAEVVGNLMRQILGALAYTSGCFASLCKISNEWHGVGRGNAVLY